jgi:hypothetical protein
MAKKTVSSEEFDRKFDNGEDVSEYFDMDSAIKKVNVDFPLWMVKELDAEAKRLHIPRQAVIKSWINEKIEYLHRMRRPGETA